MSGEAHQYTPYEVNYSVRVEDTLAQLGRDALARGEGAQFVAALREFHWRLCIYPQFGDPLMDLILEAGHIRLGIVSPLVMRYGVSEDTRTVFVAGVPVLLSRPA